MRDAIPQRWAEAGPSNVLNGIAEPGETFAFQIGVWAARASLSLAPQDVTWTDLTPTHSRFVTTHGSGDVRSSQAKGSGSQGPVIPQSSIRCPNLGGVNYRGETFQQNVSVNASSVSERALE